MKQFRVLSLGAGVQSTTLFLLSARGELPPLDAAIFADTGYEPAAVYRHLAWLEAVADIPISRVQRGNIREDTLTAQRVAGGGHWASMPFFVRGPADELGQIMRQCTDEYKLIPIRKQVRALCGIAPGAPARDIHVEQWIGISADELRRVRQSRDYWITLRYPLIFDLSPAWNRSDCVAWLRREYPDHPVPRSACISCPFHSNAEWVAMRECDPESWAEAVAFDRAIRQLEGMRGRTYLHASRVPLDEAPIDNPDQGSLFNCGVCDT